jgi:hypothetical protein
MRKYTCIWLSLVLVFPCLLWTTDSQAASASAGDASSEETFTITAPTHDIPIPQVPARNAKQPTVHVKLPPTACTIEGQPTSELVTTHTESEPNPFSPPRASTPLSKTTLYEAGTLSDANQARALLAALSVPYDKSAIIIENCVNE